MTHSKRVQLAILVITSLFLFFNGLDSNFLTNWDEAWHAAISRNMARSGDFITPIYNGKVWFATSPFYLWLTALWYKFIGISEMGTRFFSALFSVETVILVYLIGKKLFSHKVGILSGLVLTTTIQYLYRGRTGNLDTTLAFFITLTIYAFLMAEKKSFWSVIMGISTAIAFLTKGVLGLLPLPLFFLIPGKQTLRAILAFLIVVIPWHLAAYLRHGEPFIQHYFFQYMFSKATVANPVSGTDVFWYLGALKHGLKLWFILFIPALLLAFIKSINTKKMRYILIWVIAPFLILTLARMRNDWYLIFLYPAIAIIIGYFLVSLAKLTNFKLILIIALVLAALNITKYKTSYKVTETVAAEVSLATQAKQLTKKNESILLDDNYLPVAVFYSDRQVIPLRFSRASDSLVSQDSLKEATQGALRKLALTNDETLEQLIKSFHDPEYQTIDQFDDKLLIEIKF